MSIVDFNKSSSEMSVDNYPTDSISVPLIDMANLGQKELDQLRSACEEWGIFHITNHDIPEKILEEFKAEVIELFSLPTDVKLRILKSGIQSPNDLWHEGFSFATHNELLEHATELWPSHGNPKFCQVMASYKAIMKTLAEKLLKLMLASLGLTPEDIDWAEIKGKEEPFGQRMSTFQLLNSYPPYPDMARAVGFGAHTDTCLVTVLNLVNNLSGLQVLRKGKWVMVDPIPGALIVNCGDLMHILTNGRFISVMHRVTPLEDKHRYSAVVFYNPPRNTLLAPASMLVEQGPLPLFQPITFKEFLKSKYGGDNIPPVYVRMDLINTDENLDEE